MKKLAVSFVLVLGFGFAAEPGAVIESAAPFEGAIEGISDIVTIAHLPGYGLNVNARFSIGEFDLDVVVEQLQGVIVGLSSLVRGLDPGDSVSVFWVGRAFMEDDVYVLVRMVPGDPATLETFINGELQN